MRIRKYDYKDQQGEKIEITFNNNPRGLQKIYVKLKTLINKALS